MHAGRRSLLVALLALGLAVAALVVWVLGIVGVGKYGQDICLDDPPAEATGYQSEGSAWPPRLTCVYEAHGGGTLEVDHRLYPTIAALWVVGFPVLAASGIGMVCVRMARLLRP